MINIQVYCSAIGLYLDRAQSLSSKGEGRLSFFVESSKQRKEVKISRYLNLKIAIIVLKCLRLLIQAIISGMQLKGGDIETNSGPTCSLEKIVHGSFHQGNSQLSGKTIGILCACNALYALCWTQIKQKFHWVRRDLNHILVEGDNLSHKSFHTRDKLSVYQLQAFGKVYNHDIPVQHLKLETQFAALINGDSFLGDLLTAGITLCLLFIEGFTTAIIFLRNCYYLFDSHSSDERGLSVVDGTSVLMKCKDLYEIEKCLQEAYLEHRDRQQDYFQLRFVEVNVG